MSHRIQITVTDTEYQAVRALADQRRITVSTLAAGALIEHTRTPVAPAEPADAAAPHPAPVPVVGPAPKTRAEWLQRGRGEEWLQVMWDAVQDLRASYPDIHDATRQGWHTDPYTRNGIFALTIWRTQIDDTAENDPRLELHWLAALSEFRRHHEEHRRCRTAEGRQPLPPDLDERTQGPTAA